MNLFILGGERRGRREGNSPLSTELHRGLHSMTHKIMTRAELDA